MVRVLGGKPGKLACERCGRPGNAGVPLCPWLASHKYLR